MPRYLAHTGPVCEPDCNDVQMENYWHGQKIYGKSAHNMPIVTPMFCINGSVWRPGVRAYAYACRLIYCVLKRCFVSFFVSIFSRKLITQQTGHDGICQESCRDFGHVQVRSIPPYLQSTIDNSIISSNYHCPHLLPFTPIHPLGHVKLGYMTLVNTAETAYHQVHARATKSAGIITHVFASQGVDLYAEHRERLISGAVSKR